MANINRDKLTALVEAALADIPVNNEVRRLYTPVTYTLHGGGKRLRPLLALATCQALCGDPSRAINQAVALEMFHNFTLIHDDVMDESPRRHGNPTVYRRWGTSQAILSGDCLLTLATARLAEDAGDRLAAALDLFNRTAVLVYEGQQLDTDFETRKKVSLNQYIHMIDLKTAVLLAASCRMGAIMAGADEEVCDAMYAYGRALGMAFQLRDDLLDVWGDELTFGKMIGNDILTRKKTWFYIRAMQDLPRRMENAYERYGDQSQRLIDGVRRVYNMLGLREKCEAAIQDYVDRAMTAVASVPMSEDDRLWFESIAHTLAYREK